MTRRASGAALITAMLTVALVASLAASALWQQWRSVEVETAERTRMQFSWVLNGALDWARLILREAAKSGAVDHLSQPWAVPLQEARLSSFLAVDKSQPDEVLDAFLSGAISDEQGLLNVNNLVLAGARSDPDYASFQRLFAYLGLPQQQLDGLLQAVLDQQSARSAGAPLQPVWPEQLVWLGLPQRSVQLLLPFVTILPQRSPLNLNTAPAEVLYASLPGVSLAQARALVLQRQRAHFDSVQAGIAAAGLQAAALKTDAYSVGSRYFRVRGRLRIGGQVVQEISLLERTGIDVRVLWRRRTADPVQGLVAPLQ